MTIQREDGYFVAECDDCGETLDTEVCEFYLVPGAMKQAGWEIKKELDGTWTHRCATCWRERMNPQADFEV